MFALRRFAVTAGRSAARPAAGITSATFGVSRHARPQNLSELRSFESLLQLRWNSSYVNNDGITNPGYRSGGGGNRDQTPLSPTKILYVGNLKYEATEEEIKEVFAKFGTINALRIPKTGETGIARGFAYVEFNELNEAAEAIDAMHQSPFQGRRLNVQYVNRADMRIKNNPESKTLFIGNLSFNTSDEDLNELFKEISGCVDVRVAMDRRTGQPRGFVHADFSDVESAVKAKELLTGTELHGRQIRIDYSVPPEERKKQWEERRSRNDSDDSSGGM